MQHRKTPINLANFNNVDNTGEFPYKLPVKYSLAGDQSRAGFYHPEQKGVSFTGNQLKNFHAPASASLGSFRIPSEVVFTPIKNAEAIKFVGLNKSSFFAEKKDSQLVNTFTFSRKEPIRKSLLATTLEYEKSRWSKASADAGKNIVKKVGVKLLDKANPGLGKLADSSLSTLGVANANVNYQKEAELAGRDKASIAACSYIRATTESDARKLGYKAIAPFVPEGLAAGPGGWVGLGVAALGVELAANEAGKVSEQSCYESFSKKPLTSNLR